MVNITCFMILGINKVGQQLPLLCSQLSFLTVEMGPLLFAMFLNESRWGLLWRSQGLLSEMVKRHLDDDAMA